jgi:outer membrane protein TolC
MAARPAADGSASQARQRACGASIAVRVAMILLASIAIEAASAADARVAAEPRGAQAGASTTDAAGQAGARRTPPRTPTSRAATGAPRRAGASRAAAPPTSPAVANRPAATSPTDARSSSAATAATVPDTVLGGPAAGDPPPAAPRSAAPLLLDEVLASVTARYPPLLAALIERDIATGRARQAEGAFDLNLNASLASTPLGYYDGRTGQVLVEQALTTWGARVYGGWRASGGELAPYNLGRTPPGGQLTAGVRMSLLRGGALDPQRAAREQARITEALVDPFVMRQRLDFVRAASLAYYNWVGAGLRQVAAEQLLRVANERDSAIAEQVRRGALAPIIRTDNERLVVSRRIALVQAQRRFEAATIELSLFVRDATDAPVMASAARLPDGFPAQPAPQPGRAAADIETAWVQRPELRNLALSVERLAIERRLAVNDLKPALDLSLEARQSPLGERRPDIEATETRLGVEFRVPLQRREAQGRVDIADGQISRLRTELAFARDRIAAEVRDAHSALLAAWQQIDAAGRNVALAEQLEAAERTRFRQGATDLLALQIREQATFDARVAEVDAQAEYFRAAANYRAAIASDADVVAPGATR